MKQNKNTSNSAKASLDKDPEQSPENIPKEIITAQKKTVAETVIETTDIKPQTAKEMEVHHHAHHTHEKKKWTHYFWEFLMLFLAVFCGFLAEYQLEHVIENQREKKYMQSFIYDLKNDTANLNEGFPRKDQRLVAIDSVFLFFEKNPEVIKIPGSIYRHMQRTLWDRHYRRNSTTIDQLKNAGGMRLIRKQNVADSIAAYDLQWQRAEFYKDAYVVNQQNGKELIGKIIDTKVLLNIYRNHVGGESLSSSITDSLVIGINLLHLNEFLYLLRNQKSTTAQDKRTYQQLEQSAERLIALIRKEYHLE